MSDEQAEPNQPGGRVTFTGEAAVYPGGRKTADPQDTAEEAGHEGDTDEKEARR